MQEVATTMMSGEGQVVIPEGIRRSMGWGPGTRFVVAGKGDTLVLKALQAPKLTAIKGLIEKVQREAKQAGLKRKHLAAVILKARAQ